MRKIIILLLTVFSISLFGQTEDEILKLSDKLIAKKQYLTAFQKLDVFDKNNLKPDIVLEKEKIVLYYFVSSIMHQMFALKNLKEDENVMDYRGEKRQYKMFSFPINKILDSLISSNPKNYKLYRGLGEFYYEVYLKYGDRWLKNNSELLKLIEKNFLIAINHNAGDYLSYYVIGYIKVIKQDYRGSIDYFKKSIAFKYDYPSSHYNLAYAYLYLNKLDDVVSEAKISGKQYKNRIYKADAYRLTGIAYSGLNDMQNAIAYLEKSDRTDKNNYYTLKILLKDYVKSNNIKREKLLNVFFNLAPDKPTIYNDLSEIYKSSNRLNELEKFYLSKLNKYKNNNLVLGNLYFYLGYMQMETDEEKAKRSLNKAKEVFLRVYPKNHQVFKVINEVFNKKK